VMEHACANDEVEGTPELPNVLDRQPMQTEIFQLVLSLKFTRMAQARLANIDCRDPSKRLAKRMPRRLRRAATGDQDFQACAELLGRPSQMEVRASALRLPVQIPVQIGYRPRIRHPFIEITDFLAPAHFDFLRFRPAS
jgi:hypothetical protein